MNFSRQVAIAVITLGVGCWAQQSDTFKVKKSAPEKLPRSLPAGKTATGPTAASTNAKDLQKLEHQTAKASEPPPSSGTKTIASTPRPASTVKLERDKPNPPINFAGRSGAKPTGTGMVKQGPNPLAGRLKQKSAQP
jgi:hypothetical protein